MPKLNQASNKTNEVSCTVSGCRYHEQNNACTATHISVANEYAQKASETACASFENKDENGSIAELF